MRNVIKRSVLVAKNNMITSDCLPEEISCNEEPVISISDDLKEDMSLRDSAMQAEKIVIEKALQESKHNKTQAARLLKIDRKTLYNKIKELVINRQ